MTSLGFSVHISGTISSTPLYDTGTLIFFKINSRFLKFKKFGSNLTASQLAFFSVWPSKISNPVQMIKLLLPYLKREQTNTV